MQQDLKSRQQTKDNVHYRVSHCATCARENADREAGIAVSTICPQRGTLHGEAKKLFQPNALLLALIKRNLVNLNSRAIKIPVLFGHWTNEMVLSNLITSAGKAGAASRLSGSGSEAAFLQIGIGTGTTAANAADTTLETEKAADGTGASGVHALSSASTTASRVTTSVTNDTARLTGTISITGSIAVTESGVFNANTNGVLLARRVFSAINVVSGDSLQLTWNVQMS